MKKAGRKISMAEVEKNDTKESVWFVRDGRVRPPIGCPTARPLVQSCSLHFCFVFVGKTSRDLLAGLPEHTMVVPGEASEASCYGLQ